MRKERRYRVYAKRTGAFPWTSWVTTEDRGFAIATAKKIVELGFLSKVVDREENGLVSIE